MGTDDPDELYVVEDNSDKCGKMARGHPPLLRLATRQGVFWIPYHGIVGLDEKEDHFIIHFRATLGWEGKAMEGCWKAVASGLRLDTILNHIGMGQRVALNPGGTTHGTDPYVASIVLTPVEPVAYEEPVKA